MEELDKGLDIALKGPEARQAVDAMQQQMHRWRLAVPPAEPLVLDFGLGDFRRIGHVECWIANQTEAGYCGKYIFLADGQTCPAHHHRQKHETFYVLKGQLRIVLEQTQRVLGEGDVLPVEPGRRHSFTGVGPTLLLELSMPCVIDDNYFENTAIPIGGNYRGRNQS